MIGNVFYFPWEAALMEWLQSHGGSAVAAAAVLFTQLGEEIVLVGLLGFLYWGVDKQIGKRLGRTILVFFLCAPMLKNLVLRRRPYFDNPNIQCLRPAEKGAELYDVAAQGFSFPSIHAGNTMTLFGGLAKQYRKWWGFCLAGFVIFMVGFSRVFLGVHYPTDVLAGWLLGLVMVTGVDWLQAKCQNDLVYGGLLLALALPGWFYCKSTDFYTAYGITIGMILGFWYEAKYVHFRNTRSVPVMLLRTVVGAALFLAINSVLKLPFDEAFLNSVSLGARLFRTVRYAAASFLILGVYPRAFGKIRER